MVKLKKGGTKMKVKEFFKGKKFIFCFVAYVLLTALIFASSLTSATASGKQSAFISNAFSNVVKFVTGGSVDLSKNGNTETYPESISLKNVPNRELMVGERFTLTYEFGDGENYKNLTPTYYSTNESVISVNKTTGEVEVKNLGNAKIGVKEEKSNLNSEVSVTVGNGEFIPKLNLIKGTSESDGNYYFNSALNVGSLYYLYIDTEIDKNSLSITVQDDSAFSLLQTTSTIAFLTKKTGTFDIVVSGQYKNVKTLETSELQTVTKTFTVSVLEHSLIKPAKDFYFENQTIETYNGEKTEILFSNDRHDNNGALLESQKTLFHSYDKGNLTVKSENGKLFITPLNVGEFDYTVLYTDGASIKSATLTVNSLFKKPTVAEFKTTNKNVVFNVYSYLTVIGDGKEFSPKDFIWQSSNLNIASVYNGKVVGVGFGKVTITATSKYDNTFIIEKTFNAIPSLEYAIRKILGHFLLFALLAFFAKIVYFRLANVLSIKNTTLISIVFTALAGILTAVISELLQLDVFVTARGFAFSDILINACGYAFGFLITLLIFYLVYKKLNKKA